MAKSICEHIRNVKSRLENAEKSFRENNGMRGELDLMLAEAEIKHLREKRGWVSVWTRQRLALLAAAIVVLAGYGGWLYAGTVEEPGVKLQNPVAVMASTELQKNLPQTEAAPNKMVPTFTDKPEQEQKTVVIPSEYPKEQVKEQQRSVELPTADMRQLVREARRTLRDAN
mgnify:FL=1